MTGRDLTEEEWEKRLDWLLDLADAIGGAAVLRAINTGQLLDSEEWKKRMDLTCSMDEWARCSNGGTCACEERSR